MLFFLYLEINFVDFSYYIFSNIQLFIFKLKVILIYFNSFQNDKIAGVYICRPTRAALYNLVLVSNFSCTTSLSYFDVVFLF